MKMITGLAAMPPALPPPRTELLKRLSRFRGKITGDAEQVIGHVAECLDMFIRISGEINRLQEKRRRFNARGNIYADMERELERLVPADFPASTGPGQIMHLARYLKALAVRVSRADADIKKDISKAERTEPFARRLLELQVKIKACQYDLSWKEREKINREAETAAAMLEEFRVSIFAPEIGTAFPVSEKKLHRQLERLKTLLER
jgi:ATP-dependent helicase HrpA